MLHSNFLFSLAYELAKHYRYGEAADMIADYKARPAQPPDALCESPKSIVKTLMTEEKKSPLHRKSSVLVAAIITAGTLFLALCMPMPNRFSNVYCAAVTVLLSLLFWVLISGADMARFSSLLTPPKKYTALRAALNAVLALLPPCILLLCTYILLSPSGMQALNPATVGIVVSCSLRTLAACAALLSLCTLLFAARFCIWFYPLCVNSLGVCGFALSLLAAMRNISSLETAVALFWASALPYVCGLCGMLLFAVYIRHLYKMGAAQWTHN